MFGGPPTEGETRSSGSGSFSMEINSGLYPAIASCDVVASRYRRRFKIREHRDRFLKSYDFHLVLPTWYFLNYDTTKADHQLPLYLCTADRRAVATTAGVEDSKQEIKSAAPGLPAWSPTAVLPDRKR